MKAKKNSGNIEPIIKQIFINCIKNINTASIINAEMANPPFTYYFIPTQLVLRHTYKSLHEFSIRFRRLLLPVIFLTYIAFNLMLQKASNFSSLFAEVNTTLLIITATCFVCFMQIEKTRRAASYHTDYTRMLNVSAYNYLSKYSAKFKLVMQKIYKTLFTENERKIIANIENVANVKYSAYNKPITNDLVIDIGIYGFERKTLDCIGCSGIIILALIKANLQCKIERFEKISGFCIGAFAHSFVVVNRHQGRTNAVNEWNDDAIIIDAWYKVCENAKNIKNNQNAFFAKYPLLDPSDKELVKVYDKKKNRKITHRYTRSKIIYKMKKR